MAKKLKSLNPIIGTGYKTLSKIKDGEDGNAENFPDTLPKIPRLSYKRLGVSGLEIGWEFEDKIYYTYELYGSTTKGFEASEENLMFQGLASSYFYEAKPGEKWYFKARAKNTHGRYTEFSSELVTYTVKLDNLGEYVEGGAINGALIENATINNAHIKDLHADKITAGVLDADRIGANSITANKIEANAITSEKIQANAITSGKIQANAITTDKLAANIIASNHIQSGAITSGHIQSGTIESDHIKSNSINSNHIQANTIQSEHIQTGAITAGSGIIAEGAIGSAQISSLDAAKIEAGTIDTSKVTIQGADGHLRLKGNRMQVFQGTGNQAKERVSLGDVNGNGSVYGLRVRGADGTTILLDENGVKSEGITDGAITNDKISDDANIDGAKLNINSVVNKINEDGTETIQGTKIEVDGTTLNTKLSTITTKQTEDSERISQAQSQITANTNAIKLKVDEQTYTTDKKDMTSKLEKNTSEISAMKGQIALKVEQTDIENAKSEMEGVIDTKVDSAKAEIKVTTDEISQNVSNLSQTVSTKADGSTVTTLSNKVGSLETSVNGISGKVSSLETTTTTLGTQVDVANTTANNAQNTANTNKNNITNLQGEVSTVKNNVASLEVTTSGISQKVSSVESTTATLSGKVDTANNNATNALNTANSTNTKLNNLQIGGRNLLRNSQNYSNWLGENGTTVSTIDNSNEPTKILQVTTNGGDSGHVKINVSNYIKGKEYILSFYAKNISGDKTINFEPHGAPVYSVTSTSEWVQYKVKIIPNLNWSSTVPYFYFNNKNNTSVFQIKNVKLEEGTKATDWTPAPEDVDGAINSVDGKLTTLQGEYNSTKSKVATLETNLDGITQRVSSTESTTATLTTKVNTVEGTANTAKSAADSAKTTATNAQNQANTNKGNITTLQNTVTTTNNKVASLETNLSSITSRVSATETTANTLTTKVDNMKIGGRNLIRKADIGQNNSTATFNDSTKTWTIKAIAGAGGTWGCGLVLKNKNVLVPYGKQYVLSFEIKVPRNCSWNTDVNNYAITGSSWAGNDNDNTSKRTTSSKSLTANQWIKCWVKWENTNSNNTNKVDLYDNSNFGVVMQNETSDMTYEIRNVQGELGNVPTEYTPAPEDVDNAITAVDNKVDSANTNISNLTNRVSTAESKLTKDSLTTTIGKHYTTSTDVDGIVTSKGYQTESQVQQTVNQLEVKFSSSGGYNLIYNGNFERGLEHWTSNGFTQDKVHVERNNNGCPVNPIELKLEGILGSGSGYVGQSFGWDSTEALTLSWYQWTSANGKDGSNTYRGTQVTIGYTDGSNSWHTSGNQTELDVWQKRSMTIYPDYGKRVSWISVEMWCRDTSKVAIYTSIMLEKGEVATNWTPNPNEIYDGITTIDKDGIKVTASDTNTYTEMDASSFRVRDNNGGTVAEFAKTSTIPTLNSGTIKAQEVYANNLVTKTKTARSYYVNGVDGVDGEGRGTSWGNACRSVQYVLDNYVEDVINSDITIYVGRSVQYWNCEGRTGSATLTFQIEDDCIVSGGIGIIGCTCYVRVAGSGNRKGTLTNGIVVTGCTRFDIGWLTFRGANWASSKGSCNVLVRNGSRGTIRMCDFNGVSYGVIVDDNVEVWFYNNIGSGVSYYIGFGAYTVVNLMRSGGDTCPDYTSHFYGDAGHANLYYYRDGANFTKTPSVGWSPSYTPTQKTQTWNFNKIWSDETLHGWSDRQELIQGYASTWNTGRWTGYIQMNDGMASIRNTISGGTNLSGRIYIQRTSSSGNSTGSKLCLYASDGTSITTTTSINRSQGVWVSLSSSIIEKIKNGSITYFYLKADSNNTATYFKCESNAKIEITYTN